MVKKRLIDKINASKYFILDFKIGKPKEFLLKSNRVKIIQPKRKDSEPLSLELKIVIFYS